ncbi:MAG: sialidase family protein [Kiritimatiellaeota bacterium]|nr:sialidase family protein [Kiritimatiellota bacterium]
MLMATSTDFQHWTAPRPLLDSMKDKQKVERVLTAAGFHQYAGTLVAYFGNYGPNKETTHLQAVTTTDGQRWSAVREIGAAINPNHGPQAIKSGRLIISGNTAFPWSDDPTGLGGWKMTGIYPASMATNFKDDPATFWDVAKKQCWNTGLCEGSFYQTDDGVLHMLLRNAAKENTHHLWLTESRDNGATVDMDHRFVLAKWLGNRNVSLDYAQAQSTASALMPDGWILTAFGMGYHSAEQEAGTPGARDVEIVRWRLPGSGKDASEATPSATK